MAETVHTINLLPQSGDNLLSQIIDWALSIGRLLVILTEIIALSVFIYRFSLDMQLVDLHDKINSDSFIVGNFQSQEDKFRDIQLRLATIKQYTAIDTTTANIFTDIVKMGQGKVTFKDLTVGTQNAKLEVQASSPTILSQFVDSLKAEPSVQSVSIDTVDNNPATAQITVSITALLKPVAFAQQVTGQNSPTTGNNQAILNNQ